MTPRVQSGQALVETLVAIAFLSPLFLGVWYVATLQNLTLSGLGGARHGFISLYVADQEVALPDLREILKTDEPGSNVMSYAGSFEISAETRMSSIRRIQSVSTLLLTPVKALSSESFDVPDAIPRRLSVRLNIDPAPWSGLGSLIPPLVIEAPVAVLVGVAASSGRAETMDIVRSLSASKPFESLMRPITMLRPALEVLEPAFKRFCPGRLEPDIVPVDRLPSSGFVQNDLRTRPCE